MILQALRKVFQKPTYMILAFTTSVLVFLFAVWLPNLHLIMNVAGSSDISLSDKLELPLNLIGSIATNFTLLSASYTIAIAIFFGLNLAMVTYYLRRRIKEIEQSGIATGFLGIMSGVLGMGCAACGSLLLTPILAFLGASSVLAFLPLAGGEFGILGVVLLAVSLYMMAKKIQDPAICKT